MAILLSYIHRSTPYAVTRELVTAFFCLEFGFYTKQYKDLTAQRELST